MILLTPHSSPRVPEGLGMLRHLQGVGFYVPQCNEATDYCGSVTAEHLHDSRGQGHSSE